MLFVFNIELKITNLVEVCGNLNFCKCLMYLFIILAKSVASQCGRFGPMEAILNPKW